MNRLFIFSLFFQISIQASMKCTYFCSCDTWKGLPRISCISQKLGSTEVNAPYLVQAIDLSKNYISEIKEKAFEKYHHLKYLNISHNKVMDIHLRAFYGIKKLIILDLSNNHLKFLEPKAFEDIPALQELNLSGNEIGHFGWPPHFNIPSLQILHMKECWLEALSESTFSQLPNLMDLDLSDNQFVTLNTKYFRYLSQLNALNLSGNPWHCNNEIQEVLAELMERNVKLTPVCPTDGKKDIVFNSSAFERMISLTESKESPDYEYDIETLDTDIYDVWFNSTSQVQEEQDEEDEEEEIEILKKCEYSFQNLMGQIPSLWALIIGLQVGLVAGIVGMWTWLRCRCSQISAQTTVRSNSYNQGLRQSFVRHQAIDINYTELNSPNCPDTPPPPYRDVLLRTFN